MMDERVPNKPITPAGSFRYCRLSKGIKISALFFTVSSTRGWWWASTLTQVPRGEGRLEGSRDLEFCLSRRDSAANMQMNSYTSRAKQRISERSQKRAASLCQRFSSRLPNFIRANQTKWSQNRYRPEAILDRGTTTRTKLLLACNALRAASICSRLLPIRNTAWRNDSTTHYKYCHNLVTS